MVFSGYQENGLITRIANVDYAVGACRDVVIAVWRKRTHLDGVAMLKEYIEERAKLHKRLSLLQIIEDDAAPPDALPRKALARMHGEHAALIRKSAVVYAKPGFSGATARAIITGVALINPPKFEHEIFASLTSALQWLYSDPKAADSQDLLPQAVEQLRARDIFIPSNDRAREIGRK